MTYEEWEREIMVPQQRGRVLRDHSTVYQTNAEHQGPELLDQSLSIPFADNWTLAV